MKKILLVLIICVITANCISATAKATLSERQKETADRIAEIADINWKEYGVLPSIAVAQAFIESSLGKNQVKPNNLWGIRPGGKCYSSYSSLSDGTYSYLGVINNGRYDKALFKKDYKIQIKYILQGGYYGEDDGGTIEEYRRNIVSSVENHHFDKYDKKLFKRLQKEQKQEEKKKKERAEKKRKKKWLKTYTIVYDPNVMPHEVSVDKKIIKQGTVQIWKNDVGGKIYDVTYGQNGYVIGVSDKFMEGMKVKIEVNEEAKG